MEETLFFLKKNIESLIYTFKMEKIFIGGRHGHAGSQVQIIIYRFYGSCLITSPTVKKKMIRR